MVCRLSHCFCANHICELKQENVYCVKVRRAANCLAALLLWRVTTAVGYKIVIDMTLLYPNSLAFNTKFLVFDLNSFMVIVVFRSFPH